jgi:hypothetical protein
MRNAYLNKIAIRKPKLLRTTCSFLLFLLRIKGNIAAFLLYCSDNLTFRGCVKVVSRFSEEQLQVISNIPVLPSEQKEVI